MVYYGGPQPRGTCMGATLKETPVPPDVTTLRNGDRMNADEFHRIYKTMPSGFKAELVGGIVYVASPLGLEHGRGHNFLGVAFGTYAGLTPGIECGDNT